MPVFRCYLPDTPHPLSENAVLWQTPLPKDRHAAAQIEISINTAYPTYGDIYGAAKRFLERNDRMLLRRAISDQLGRLVPSEEISEIHLTLMKHGAFYHPAIVSVYGLGIRVNFVLNSAVSDPGKQTIEGEYNALEKLGKTAASPFIPSVYGYGVERTDAGRKIKMFLGDWLEGFHEFHPSRNPEDASIQLRVWNNEKKPFYLASDQRRALYRQASYILTACYNPLTSEHIFPWHHAAGDFVVRFENSVLEVRLITVRCYAPMFRSGEFQKSISSQPERIMEALFLFFLNLSIRMRIDRLDGIGDLIWAEEDAVSPIWEGFLAGLQHGFFLSSAMKDLNAKFLKYIHSLPIFEIFESAEAAAGGFHPDAPERALINAHLIEHVAALWAYMQNDRQVS